MKDRQSQAWWAELKEYERDEIRLEKWCCKLVVQGSLQYEIEEMINAPLGLRLKVNFCPHCGRMLKRTILKTDVRCCAVVRDLGIEGMQYEAPDGQLHRILVNYCFVCGRNMKEYIRKSMEAATWRGCDCECNECDKKNPEDMLPPSSEEEGEEKGKGEDDIGEIWS